jgi:hypothetical protein
MSVASPSPGHQLTAPGIGQLVDCAKLDKAIREMSKATLIQVNLLFGLIFGHYEPIAEDGKSESPLPTVVQECRILPHWTKLD